MLEKKAQEIPEVLSLPSSVILVITQLSGLSFHTCTMVVIINRIRLLLGGLNELAHVCTYSTYIAHIYICDWP